MICFAVFVVFWGAANAIVCIPELCEGVKQVPLNCAGSVIKGGGFCGCSDVCAKMEGETCQARYMHGIIPAGSCDTGLVCKEGQMMAFGAGTCVKATSKRSTKTKCQQMRMSAMITMIVYASKWTPNCDADGNFTPQQCDFSGHCFCVDAMGVMQGSKVLGKVDCPSN
ncbi:saxiphilin-like isoform X2 [Haliotis cracherodii]|uniref:saxiphilin-like isoform X2 n=1 Tax=Haliotis cracherodii TaxID=6455 RepID=UPI0039EAA4F2